MLALTLNKNNQIVLDGGIVIQLLKAQGKNEATVLIRAPQDTSIWREPKPKL